jgi:exonuclease SbcC
LEEVDAACPLCGQPLTKEHRQQLLGEINNSGHSLGDIHRHNTTRLQTLLDEQKLLQANINSLEIDLKLRPAQEKLVARLQQQIEQGNDAQERIIALHTQLQTLEKILVAEQYAEEERQVMQSINEDIQDVQQQIDGQQYAPEIKKAMQAVAVEFGTIGYDAAYHEEVKAQVQALFPIEEQHRELGNARADSQRDIEMQNRLSADIEGQKARLHALENAYLKCQEELNELQSVLSKGDMLAQLLNESRQTAVNTRQHMGAVKQNLAAMQTLEKRGNELREKRVELAHSTAIYTEIRDACGVNGIPAMIIEHTLPELEREANKILQQLTGGRMHVRFETQRETKSGTLRETLDIIISDEKGTRPYENFSGGEQFRVNFAIRVALSRLLARRSGVRLRSLFVDEGFGSLDADGRQRLVEAIKTVQDSFHLILVITHIDELREAFPTQILVSKSDAGSLVEVV